MHHAAARNKPIVRLRLIYLSSIERSNWGRRNTVAGNEWSFSEQRTRTVRSWKEAVRGSSVDARGSHQRDGVGRVERLC